MGDPIARVQNPFPNNIVTFVENLPKTEMPEDKFKEYMAKCKWGADAFFRSYYQICCQIGLYYIDENHIYHPRFLRDINEDEAKTYMKYWFSRYYVPNPYTRAGFENLRESNPILVEYSIYEYLKQTGETVLEQVCLGVFKEPIGNPDIFINTVNSYSSLIEIDKDTKECFIREGVEDKMEVLNSWNDRAAFFDYFADNSEQMASIPHNLIFFGAPGTGKSFMLNKEAKKLLSDGGYEERVTFHPDYSYANFVGTYKPVMVNEASNSLTGLDKEVVSVLADKTKSAQEKYDLLYDKFKGDGVIKGDGVTRLPILLGLYTDEDFKIKRLDGTYTDNSVERNHGKALRPYVTLPTDSSVKEEISYEYVPGPFMRVLVKAIRSQKEGNHKPHLLIIEEINRANVAAVFGDVFQLLDRTANNVSEYEITTTNEMRVYLAKELGVEKSAVETIKIPNNMFIWATMNSADQGVFPMDTAFKRRWSFEYIGINSNEADMKNSVVELGKGNYHRRIKWNDLRHAINDYLADELKINEDKQLGPYFIGRSIVVPENGTEINSKAFNTVFKNKVLMYLFDDAAKQKRQSLFSGVENHNNRYSSICEAFDLKGIFIFNDKICSQVQAQSADNTELTETNN